MAVATLETKTKIITVAATAVVTLSNKLPLIAFSLCGGLVIEFIMRYMIDNYHWTVAQPISSALYSALCVSLFFLYGKTYSKRILVLSAVSGIYGLLLLVTLNGTYYTYLNGFIWNNSLNFELFYRATEIVIFIRTLHDARVVDWFRNTAFYSRIRMRLFRDKDSFTGVA